MALADEAVTLAERLAAGGYDTAAFVSSFPVSRRFGLGQGFAHFDDAFAREGAKIRRDLWEGIDDPGAFDRKGYVTVDRALAWLAQRSKEKAAPLFVWVHLFEPHAPYFAPAEVFERFLEPGMRLEPGG